MTLREWMRARWARAPGPERISIVPKLQTMPRVRAGYASLVVLTFEQMEALLGFALPEAARREPGWWTDTAADRNPWTVAKRTATPNLLARNVAFERIS
jgi:hypothetical protein